MNFRDDNGNWCRPETPREVALNTAWQESAKASLDACGYVMADLRMEISRLREELNQRRVSAIDLYAEHRRAGGGDS